MSKIHKLQKKCRDDYDLEIDVHRLFRLVLLVRELKTVLKHTDGIGKDYTYYMDRYKTLKRNAEELGVTVSESLRNPSVIKHEIANIFNECNFNDTYSRTTLLEWMGLSDKVKKLPRPKSKNIDDDLDVWSNYEPTEEERLRLEQDLKEHEAEQIEYYNSQI